MNLYPATQPSGAVPVYRPRCWSLWAEDTGEIDFPRIIFAVSGRGPRHRSGVESASLEIPFLKILGDTFFYSELQSRTRYLAKICNYLSF